MSVLVANRKIDVVPSKYTWLEAIHRNNMAHKVMVPNSVLSINGPPLYQSYPGGGRLNPLPPDKILDGRGLYSGTAGVIGYKDKPLGKRVETECDYEGQRKTTIFEVNEEQAGLIDTAVL